MDAQTQNAKTKYTNFNSKPYNKIFFYQFKRLSQNNNSTIQKQATKYYYDNSNFYFNLTYIQLL